MVVVEQLPWEVRKYLRWRLSPITPNIVKSTVARSGFRYTKSRKNKQLILLKSTPVLLSSMQITFYIPFKPLNGRIPLNFAPLINSKFFGMRRERDCSVFSVISKMMLSYYFLAPFIFILFSISPIQIVMVLIKRIKNFSLRLNLINIHLRLIQC